jgi:hypothetical protein
VTDEKKAHFGSSFFMNRTVLATFETGPTQLFHSAKMASIRLLSDKA